MACRSRFCAAGQPAAGHDDWVDRRQRVNAVLERTIGYQLTRPLADRAWRIPPPKMINSVLVRATGYHLSRPRADRVWKLPPGGGGRLLTEPVFIFSAPRSGSTLLRAVLGSHSELYAPPELPLKHLGVRADTKWIEASLDGLELTIEDLEHMLWDRVLADALQRSGKPRIVVKTPSNVLIWERDRRLLAGREARLPAPASGGRGGLAALLVRPRLAA